MAGFQRGDRVIVDGNLVAEIENYDEDANLVVYIHRVGGAENRVTAHISLTRLEAFPGGNVELNDSKIHVEESADDEEEQAPVDQFTSLD